MTRTVATAGVWRGTERAGSITRTVTGSVFAYDDAFLAARPHDEQGIAHRLSYAAKRFETSGVNLHPFFAGLLPEGLRLRAIVRLVKTSEDDLLSLLVASGSDTVGDVAVVPHGVAPAETPADAEIDHFGDVVFSELFAKSLGRLAKPGEGWSVAGVQPKVSAVQLSFPVRAKKGRGAWILKLDNPDLPHLVRNEAFFLEAARDSGLATPKFRVVEDRSGASGLLVARFDRVAAAPDAPLVRVHQEDACQLLDRYPADKYHLSLRDVADALADACAVPVLAVAWLIRLQAFSYAIANGDLHAKNVSVRREPTTGRDAPAPAYDLVSTLPYGDDRMALAMEGRDRNLRRRDFVAFGERLGVRAAATTGILDEVVEGLGPWTKQLERIGLDTKRTAHLRKSIAKRLEALTG